MAEEKEQKHSQKSNEKIDLQKVHSALSLFQPSMFPYFNSELLLAGDPEQIIFFLRAIHLWGNEKSEIVPSLQSQNRALLKLVIDYWNATFKTDSHKQQQIKDGFRIFLADSQLAASIKYLDTSDILFLFKQSGEALIENYSGHSLAFSVAASSKNFLKFVPILNKIPLEWFNKTDKMQNSAFHFAIRGLFETTPQDLFNPLFERYSSNNNFSWHDSLQAIYWLFENKINANAVNAVGDSPFDLVLNQYKKVIDSVPTATKDPKKIIQEIDQLAPFMNLILWFDRYVGLAQIRVKSENQGILNRIIDNRVKILKKAVISDLLIQPLAEIVAGYMEKTDKNEQKLMGFFEKFGVRTDAASSVSTIGANTQNDPESFSNS